jgi:hypothetical protein
VLIRKLIFEEKKNDLLRIGERINANMGGNQEKKARNQVKRKETRPTKEKIS